MKIHSILAVILLVGVLGAPLACTPGMIGSMGADKETGKIITEGQKNAIVKGKTTKAEILRELGEPDSKEDLGSGKEKFGYHYQKSITSGLMVPTTELTTIDFWITFNKGVVEDFGENKNKTQDTGYGTKGF